MGTPSDQKLEGHQVNRVEAGGAPSEQGGGWGHQVGRVEAGEHWVNRVETGGHRVGRVEAGGAPGGIPTDEH